MSYNMMGIKPYVKKNLILSHWHFWAAKTFVDTLSTAWLRCYCKIAMVIALFETNTYVSRNVRDISINF